jgi:F-type H+-transporting ATPase subunit b
MLAQAEGQEPVLAHESKEAAGEEENDSAQFKKSPAVQLVSRLTGLSLDNAYWLSVVLNFAILAGAVIWLSAKGLPAMFRNRTASIQKAMAEARQASEEARQRLSEIESRLGRLDSEISVMQQQAERDTAAEEARIKAGTDEEVRKVVEAAEQEIVAAGKAARRDLSQYAANLAVSLAKSQIRINEAQDESLVRGFARELNNPDSRGND